MDVKKVYGLIPGSNRWSMRADVTVAIADDGSVVSATFDHDYCLTEGLEKPLKDVSQDDLDDLLADAIYTATVNDYD